MTEYAMLSFPPRVKAPIAINNVTVIPMDRERQLRGQTVILENGWIKSIGKTGNYITKSMIVIDGTGKYLFPGLADMHVHYWMPGDAALFLSHGVTLVRNMSGAPFHLALQAKVENGELPGPRIITSCPIIDADKYMLPMWKTLRSPSDANALVRRYIARGYQQIKVLNSISRDTLKALGTACKKHGIRLTGHCPLNVTYEEAIELGMTSFEHLVGIWRGNFQKNNSPTGKTNLSLDVVEAVANHLDYEAIRRLASYLAEQEIWNCPTLVTEQFMQLPFNEGMSNGELQPFLKFVPKSVFPLWELLDSNRRYANDPGILKRWRRAIRGRADVLAKVTKILHEEGAPLLIGTDTSVRFVLQGISVHQELENFVRIGISPFDALRSATSEPARFLGKSHEYGTIAVGKRADLILADANPLDDITTLRTPFSVFVNGYHLSRKIIDGLLTNQAESASRDPINILPSTGINDSKMEGQVFGCGNWTEVSGDTTTGELSYRHLLLPNGGWKIDEKYSFVQNSIFDVGGGRLRSMSLLLNPDFTIRSGIVSEESFAGNSRIEFSKVGGKLLQVRQAGEDGFLEEYEIIEDELLPDISLSISIPALLPYRDMLIKKKYYRVMCLLASVKFERIQVWNSNFEPTASQESTVSDLEIKSEYQDYKLECIYHFYDDEQLKYCEYGRRRFVPK